MKTSMPPHATTAGSGRPASACSALPTPDEIKADPDRILELYDCCPKCGGTALEALTWKSIGSDDVTVGCWNPDCDWWITPPGYVPPDTQNDSSAADRLRKTPQSH